jgi:hypothetical protein
MPRAADIKDYVQILRIAWYFGAEIREDRSVRRWLQSSSDKNRPTLKPFINRIQKKTSLSNIMEFQMINGLKEFVGAVSDSYGYDKEKLYEIAETPLAFEGKQGGIDTVEPGESAPVKADTGAELKKVKDAAQIVRCVAGVFSEVYLIRGVQDWFYGRQPSQEEFLKSLRQVPVLADMEEVKLLNGLEVFIKAFSKLTGHDPGQLRKKATAKPAFAVGS